MRSQWQRFERTRFASAVGAGLVALAMVLASLAISPSAEATGGQPGPGECTVIVVYACDGAPGNVAQPVAPGLERGGTAGDGGESAPLSCEGLGRAECAAVQDCLANDNSVDACERFAECLANGLSIEVCADRESVIVVY